MAFEIPYKNIFILAPDLNNSSEHTNYFLITRARMYLQKQKSISQVWEDVYLFYTRYINNPFWGFTSRTICGSKINVKIQMWCPNDFGPTRFFFLLDSILTAFLYFHSWDFLHSKNCQMPKQPNSQIFIDCWE